MAIKKDRTAERIAAEDIGEMPASIMESLDAQPPAAEAAEPPPAPPEPPPAPPEVTTVEEWARRKGMLTRYTPVAAPFARKGAAQRTELNPLFEKWAAARAHSTWPIGKELTEAEFDAAVVKATTQIYR